MPNKFSRVFVTGGAGYVGSRAHSAAARARLRGDELRYFLLRRQLPAQEQPEPHRSSSGDIRDTAKLAKAIAGHDAFISLACISNDASFELDENLSTSVNLDAFEPMVLAAKNAGVKRFIYRLVELGLRRLRPAERDRGASAGPAHALQQVQGHVRAAAVQAHGRELRRRDLSPRDGVRLRPAAALRPDRSTS